jgi:NAD kinase
MTYERLVLVTRQTELEALVQRFQTRSQAEFYLTQAGQDFASIASRHETYQLARTAVKAAIPSSLQLQEFDRTRLTQYRFEPADVVVALGQDGLVANVAKYLDGQPLLAVNPDPANIDGILLPVQVESFRAALARTLTQTAEIRAVTMAEAKLSDGQQLRAVNDIFVGVRSHTSARYRISDLARSEEQSSSGVIVSTGVGSTGWLRSVYAGATGIVRALNPEIAIPAPEPLPWDTDRLVFNVREPWPSLTTHTALVSGVIPGGKQLELMSRMPAGGVVFGDGMEEDYLEFNAGVTATIGVAQTRLNLVLR